MTDPTTRALANADDLLRSALGAIVDSRAGSDFEGFTALDEAEAFIQEARSELDAIRAQRCGWCTMPEDVTQHAPGHDDEPETSGRHRFVAAAVLDAP